MTGPFRFTSPVPAKSATGVVADVYAQLDTDFGIQAPATFTVLSSAPPVLAATWALMRESLLAGQTSRTAKELVATGVSLANECEFCINAHTMLLYAGGDCALAETIGRGEEPADPAQARLLAWGRAIGAPSTERPFPPEQAAEFIGTALAFHFINRIASALLSDSSMTDEAQKARFLESAAGRRLSDAIARELRPGTSLPIVDTSRQEVAEMRRRFSPSHDNSVPQPAELEEPDWAVGTPVGAAYGALREAGSMGAGLLSDGDQAFVRKVVADWDGVTTHPFLPEAPSAGARLALLAALAPNRITGEDVQAWKTPQHSDHCTVHLIAYGAILAVERIEESL
ncbi:carboxymuconolactone decarboxylase family protein [Streptomyces spiramyceticus]|uniref:carboxymuconolactone decarboxylase family protein n=1 Tax=Streptomyces spiramyceticus TaxID=299717 RepID=UPI00237AA8C9|nr:carboxymuconolactone decarboxylase family protein [Streptomyces spiramyceticus]